MTSEGPRDPSLSDVTGTLSTRGYNLIRKLGEGTYAKVYMASYTPNNDAARKMFLACKVVDTTKAPKDFVKKFLPRELDILKRLNHPHIVHVHSIFQRRNKYFIFMRLAEKGDLLEWVLHHGAVTEAQSRVWLRQLSLALQYLQALEVAHRDLKCENVLITANYNVKLADFGFARYTVDSRGRRVLSSTNCGSLSYAAPEILRGEHYDPRISDVWSLGVVLYIMLNKAMPFDDENINRLHDEQINRRWRFCASVVDNLSEQVKNLIYNMLEPDTQRRYLVDQVLASSWLAMDPRLAATTPAEETALAAARVERDRWLKKNEADPTALALSSARPPPGGPSEMRAAAAEVESIRYRADSRGTEDFAQAAESALPRTPEEMDIIAERKEAKPNPHTQPSHGAISIMENEPVPMIQPPEFLPPDLSEKLTSKAPSQTSKKIVFEIGGANSPHIETLPDKQDDGPGPSTAPKSEDPRPMAPKSEGSDPMALESQGSEHIALKPQDPEPIALKPQDPEPIALKPQDSAPIALKPQDSEPIKLIQEDPPPTALKTHYPEPIALKQEDPEPIAQEPVDLESTKLKPPDSEPITPESRSPEPESEIQERPSSHVE